MRQRSELILNQLQNTGREFEVDENEGSDEVSMAYYGRGCECSRNAICKSNKCICFIRGEPCSNECHGEVKTKCKNKS